jgi:hypothetical protein
LQGTVDDQYPVMHVDGKHYTMSLRMMKAVWRSVRLRKGFVNLERAPFGGNKLRIPSLLFFEKMRTQSRFNVRRCRIPQLASHSPTHVNSILKCGGVWGWVWQLMRGDSHNASTDAPAVCCPKARKQMHNASSKVAVVVEKMLLPLLDTPLRSHVVFDPVCDQAELNLLEEVDHKNPGLMADCGAFTSHILTLYDRYHAYHRHSAHTMTTGLASPAPPSPEGR